MTKEEAIKYLQQLYPNGGHCWLDDQRIEAIGMAINALQEEPVSDETMTIRKEWFEHCKKSWYNEGYIDGEYNRKSQFEESVSEDLEKAAVEAFKQIVDSDKNNFLEIFKAGAKWQKERDSNLPEVVDRENLDEYAYQVTYDLSNDWMKVSPTWDDVEVAVKLGAKWQKEKDQKK